MFSKFLFHSVVAKQKDNVIRLQTHRCLRSRFNKNSCRICIDQCEPGALCFEESKIVYNHQKCTGCMRCFSACPNDCFHANIDLSQLLKKIHHSDTALFITCSKNRRSDSTLLIPCLGFLTEPLLAVINSVAHQPVVIDVSLCQQCENSFILPPLHNAIDTLTDTLARNNNIQMQCTVMDQSLSSCEQKSNRRNYLRFIKKSLMDMRKEPADYGKGYHGTSLSRHKKRAVSRSVALQYGYANSSAEKRRALSPYLYSVKVTEHCDLCPGCQGMCPTGALKRKKTDGEKKLVFTSSRCNGCGLCQQFCKKQAIEVIKGYPGDPVKAEQVV